MATLAATTMRWPMREACASVTSCGTVQRAQRVQSAEGAGVRSVRWCGGRRGCRRCRAWGVQSVQGVGRADLMHRNRLLRDDEHVDGRLVRVRVRARVRVRHRLILSGRAGRHLRVDVVEGEAQLVLVQDVRGDLLADDLTKDGVAALRVEGALVLT